MSILEIKDLNKSYKKGFIPKKHEVLKGVSFKLESQAITGFLGGNGAGKTTTIKCMLGLATPDSGSIHFFGGQRISKKTKSRIGYLPERPYFYEYLSGREFLYFYGQLSAQFSKKVLKERVEILLKKMDLSHSGDKKLKDYSKGMLQKVGVAQALIHDPELVILDEPMSGLDPDGRFYIAEIIKQFAKEGRSVFFSSHLLHDAEALCQRLVILKNGQVSFEGPLENFLAKMGDAAIVNYILNNKKMNVRVNDEVELQNQLKKLMADNAKIESVIKDRSLEQAFIKLGLREREANGKQV